MLTLMARVHSRNRRHGGHEVAVEAARPRGRDVEAPGSVDARIGYVRGIVAGLIIRLVTCTLVLIFFEVGYSWGYRSHSGPGIIDAALPVDMWIPMVPEFIVFYMLGYLFVLVPFMLVRDRQAFHSATIVFCLMMGLAFLLFRFAPVYMEKSYAIGSDWFSRVAHFQQTKDTSYNNFPSLHVALNVYAYALIAWQSRGISALWLPLPVLIICSTLLVKQHLFVDVVGGLLLAWAGFAAFRRLMAAPPALVFRCWLVTMGVMLMVLVTHLERLGRTARKVGVFLGTGGISPSEAGVAVLVLLGSAAGMAWLYRWVARRWVT